MNESKDDSGQSLLTADPEAAYRRVCWHSRRGMLELDLVLEPYVSRAYPSLSEERQALYRHLLTQQDQDLFNWFLRKSEAPDADLRSIVDEILAFKRDNQL